MRTVKFVQLPMPIAEDEMVFVEPPVVQKPVIDLTKDEAPDEPAKEITVKEEPMVAIQEAAPVHFETEDEEEPAPVPPPVPAVTTLATVDVQAVAIVLIGTFVAGALSAWLALRRFHP